MRGRMLLLIAACGLLSGVEAGADSLGIESIAATLTTSSNEARGYRFRAEADLLVTGLALYDIDGDGIGIEGFYDLHLWSDGGLELATATLPHGSAAPLQNGFRIVAIPQVVLSAGEIYRVSVDFGDGAGGAELLLNPTEITTNSAITLLANIGTSPATLSDFGLRGPDDSFPTESDFATVGPNIVFALVPEPATGLLVALGVLVLGCRARATLRAG